MKLKAPARRLFAIGALLLLATAPALAEEVPAPPATTPPAPPAAPAATVPPAPAPKPTEPVAPLATPPTAHAEEKPSPSPFVPAWEAKLLAERTVGAGGVKYRPFKGLEITSQDKAYSMVIKLRAQVLYQVNHPATGSADQSFQLRRARIAFSGNVFGKHNKYKVELAISPGDMGVRNGVPQRTPLLDWFFEFDYLRDLSLRVGQYKVSYNRQRLVSSGDLQLVDRSIANAEFNLDRDIGFDLYSKDFLGTRRLRYNAGLYIGEGRDAFQQGDFGFMYLGRIEVLPMGPFADYIEADLERSLRPRLAIGVAYAWLDDGKGNRGILGSKPADGGTTDTHNVTADLMFMIGGFSLLSEFHYREGERTPGGAKDAMDVLIPVELPRNGYGVFAQAGYLIPRLPLEVAARYSRVAPIDAATSSLHEANEVGGGLNFYAAHHSLKLQADYFRLWGPKGIDQGSDQVRLQLQVSL